MTTHPDELSKLLYDFTSLARPSLTENWFFNQTGSEKLSSASPQQQKVVVIVDDDYDQVQGLE
ncbi:MAG: hypothetical protein ABL888_07440, partial [Pirellulaceae bacterium]